MDNTQYTGTGNKELNFFDLVHIFYKYKFLIIIVIILTAVMAYAGSFLVPDQWESTAIVKEPKLADIQTVLSAKQKYDEELMSNLSNLKLANNNPAKKDLPQDKKTNKAENSPSPNTESEDLVHKLFKNFYINAMSTDYQAEFLTKTRLYERLIKTKKNNDLALEALKNNLNVACKESELFLTCDLTFVSDNAQDAQKSLISFIDFINEESSKDLLSEVTIDIKQAITRLEIELRNLEITAFKNLKLEAPARNVYDSGLYLESTRPNVKYPARYYQVLESLKHLKQLSSNIGIVIKNYSYQQSPTLPLTKKSPKRLLILLCGAILGLLIGCYTAMHKNYKNNMLAQAGSK